MHHIGQVEHAIRVMLLVMPPPTMGMASVTAPRNIRLVCSLVQPAHKSYCTLPAPSTHSALLKDSA